MIIKWAWTQADITEKEFIYFEATEQRSHFRF